MTSFRSIEAGMDGWGPMEKYHWSSRPIEKASVGAIDTSINVHLKKVCIASKKCPLVVVLDSELHTLVCIRYIGKHVYTFSMLLSNTHNCISSETDLTAI